MSERINRRALVARHAVRLRDLHPEAPLSVGNGDFCYTADVTGMQTVPDAYPVAARFGEHPGSLLGTLSSWGWHSSPGGEDFDLADAYREYDSPRGRVPYVDLRSQLSATEQSGQSRSDEWLRNNPHRLDLGRVGLDLGDPVGAEFTEIDQRLDLWSGVLTSEFETRGKRYRVMTVADPHASVVAFRIAQGGDGPRTGVRLAFPYGSEAWANAADWSNPLAHTTALVPATTCVRLVRVLDSTRYFVDVRVSGGCEVRRTGPHEFVIMAGADEAEVVVAFGQDALKDPPSFEQVATAAERWWAEYWRGGVMDLSGSTDDRAEELERRVVLSQYLTAIHCAGSTPPAETGLMLNSWRGKFHLEMHWWHTAHFAQWGHVDLLERSLGWYERALPGAQQTAAIQRTSGARWPKQVGPEGRESPSHIGPFLVWQQPHPIHLSELVYRARPTREVLERYATIVFETAEWMAAFPGHDEAGYHLGPPLVPAQESYADQRARVTDPPFELAYWSWALAVANRWRERLGLPANLKWSRVARGMASPLVRDGTYTAIAEAPYLVRDDHPSMLAALGVVPATALIDSNTMRATLHSVMRDWDWASTWGWDYPMAAMTATRLGEPELAVRALSMSVQKNTFLVNGHNRQDDSLPIYLPGNGGLLIAAGLMVAGWDGNTRAHPGFPSERWRVRADGILPLP